MTVHTLNIKVRRNILIRRLAYWISSRPISFLIPGDHTQFLPAKGSVDKFRMNGEFKQINGINAIRIHHICVNMCVCMCICSLLFSNYKSHTEVGAGDQQRNKAAYLVCSQHIQIYIWNMRKKSYIFLLFHSQVTLVRNRRSNIFF